MARTIKTDPKTAVAYIRHSTEDQRLSEGAQRAAVEAWAKGEGVTVVAWHLDAGVSGGADLADRPALVAALADLRAKRAGLFLVAKRDRLARDPMIANAIENAAKSAGGRVVTADGLANGDSAAEEFMRLMLDGVAKMERRMIAQRTKAALATKRAAGFRAGNTPFGFIADENGRLSPHAGEQAILAEIRRLRADGRTLHSIREEMERAGVVGRTGRALGYRQIWNIIAAENPPHVDHQDRPAAS